MLLPTSFAKKAPEETVVIAITRSAILVQGRKVADVAELEGVESEDIPPLKDELLFLSGVEAGAEAVPAAPGRSITIMGDENISYDIVRKILKSCQQANYTNIAFAATQVAKKN